MSNSVSDWIEKWVSIAIIVEGVENPPHYEVSNFGRLRSFQGYDKKGKIIKGSVIQGYKSLNIRLPQGKSFNRYVHKLVAEFFTTKLSDEHKFVIHLTRSPLPNSPTTSRTPTGSKLFFF